VATVQATLFNAVGQEVGRYALPAIRGAAATVLPTAALASGVYLLRLTARDTRGQVVGQLPAQRLGVQ